MAFTEKFKHLNRAAVTIRFKQALYDWINSVTPGDDPIRPDPQDNGNVYLLPVNDDEELTEKDMKKMYLEIFKNELWSWYTDEKLWPKDLSWQKFKEFFEIIINVGVIDLAGDEPVYEGE
jgi:hypothetical protein